MGYELGKQRLWGVLSLVWFAHRLIVYCVCVCVHRGSMQGAGFQGQIDRKRRKCKCSSAIYLWSQRYTHKETKTERYTHTVRPASKSICATPLCLALLMLHLIVILNSCGSFMNGPWPYVVGVQWWLYHSRVWKVANTTQSCVTLTPCSCWIVCFTQKYKFTIV